jgi:hypothetical protein
VQYPFAPPGHRSLKLASLPLKRGMLHFAYSRRLAVQIVITRGKEAVMSEKTMSVHWGRTLVTTYSKVGGCGAQGPGTLGPRHCSRGPPGGLPGPRKRTWEVRCSPERRGRGRASENRAPEGQWVDGKWGGGCMHGQVTAHECSHGEAHAVTRCGQLRQPTRPPGSVQVMKPADYDSFDAFFDDIQLNWDACWQSSYDKPSAGAEWALQNLLPAESR